MFSISVEVKHYMERGAFCLQLGNGSGHGDKPAFPMYVRNEREEQACSYKMI